MPVSLPTATDPEADLLRRWRDQRDRAALDELAGRLMPAGWRAARAFAREHAEDVLQDAFLALTTGAAGWRGGAVRSWFVGIVANTARDHLRRQRRRPAPLPPELPAPPEPSAPELAERVMAALLRLPEHERVPLWLNVVEGQDCGDIAVQLGRPAGTVRSQVARAFERLRGQLGAAVTVTAISTALHQQAWAAEPPAGLAAKLGDSAAVAKAVVTATIPTAVLAVAVAVTVAVASMTLLWYRPPTSPVLVAPADAIVPLPEAPPAASVRVLGAGPFQHDDDLRSIAISPDGTRMAVGTEKGLHIWDIASRRQLLAIDTSSVDPRKGRVSTPDGFVEQSGRRIEGMPIHLAWLPGDRLLGLVMSEPTRHYAGLWEAGTGRLIRQIPLSSVSFCQPAMIDNSILLVPGELIVPGESPWKMKHGRPIVLALRLDNGSELQPIIGATPNEADRRWSVAAIAVNTDGTRVACLAARAEAVRGNVILTEDLLSVWSWPERKKLAERRVKPQGWNSQLEWLADGRLLLRGEPPSSKPVTIMLPADLSGEESVERGALHYAADGSRLRIEPGRATLIAADGGERTLTGWTLGQASISQVAWRPGRVLALAHRHGRAPWLYDLAADRLLAPAPASFDTTANSLVWLPDGNLLVAGLPNALCYAGGVGEARILPYHITRQGSGDIYGGQSWGWQDGKLRVLARRDGNRRFFLLDPTGTSAPRDLELPTTHCYFTAVSPDLRWAIVDKEGACTLLNLHDGMLEQWRHPNRNCNLTSVRWVGDKLLISNYTRQKSYAGDDECMTGVWSLRPFQRLHRFRRTDGSEILEAVDVVPHPDGERALVVPNDDANRRAVDMKLGGEVPNDDANPRAWLCRIADGACLDEIASPGGGAVWTADGAVVAGRRAAVSLATRQPTRVFADLHAPLAQAGHQDLTTTGAHGVAIGQVQPSPSGTQVAVCAGDRLLVVDARSGAICATIPLARNLVPALAAWSPGEAEIALADSAGPTVVVVTVAQASSDAAADRALLADATKPQDQRRAALARLEAAARAGVRPALPEAGQDARLAAWLADAAQRAKPEVPPPARPAPAPQPNSF